MGKRLRFRLIMFYTSANMVATLGFPIYIQLVKVFLDVVLVPRMVSTSTWVGGGGCTGCVTSIWVDQHRHCDMEWYHCCQPCKLKGLKGLTTRTVVTHIFLSWLVRQLPQANHNTEVWVTTTQRGYAFKVAGHIPARVRMPPPRVGGTYPGAFTWVYKSTY
jgi:hypothetical protein